MNLLEARARAVQYSKNQQCVAHINVSVKLTTYPDNTYVVDPTAYTISDWRDGSTVETYVKGEKS